jgi:hypothetical protein
VPLGLSADSPWCVRVSPDTPKRREMLSHCRSHWFDPSIAHSPPSVAVTAKRPPRHGGSSNPHVPLIHLPKPHPIRNSKLHTRIDALPMPFSSSRAIDRTEPITGHGGGAPTPVTRLLRAVVTSYPAQSRTMLVRRSGHADTEIMQHVTSIEAGTAGRSLVELPRQGQVGRS